MQIQIIQAKIYQIRGYKVMLNFDLAELYEVETRTLKQAVKRNMERFPEDFMFELTENEFRNLRSQFVISSLSWGGTRYRPYAFTEQGVSMLSSVLKSKKAIQVNILIMRAFVSIRQHLFNYKDLKEQIEKLEKEMNLKFKDIYEALNYLLQKEREETEYKERKQIGFKSAAIDKRHC
jgi:hypothetical protein